MGLDWPLPAELTDDELERRLFLRPGIEPGQRRRTEPDWAALARELKRPGVNLMVLWEEWRRGIVDVEVLRSEFDAHGYDIVMTRDPIVRHIQFKTGTANKPGDVSVALALGKKPSGCVIWIRVASNLEMGPFYWFGGSPGEPLPPIADFPNPLRPTRNQEGQRPPRQNHRAVPASQFRLLATLDDVLEALFGRCPIS